MEAENDTLEDEIARLEAELAFGVGGDQKNRCGESLGQFLSDHQPQQQQPDQHQQHQQHYNHASFLVDSSACLSYDEITVDTTEYTQLMHQPSTTTMMIPRRDQPTNISIGRASGSFRDTKDIIVEEEDNHHNHHEDNDNDDEAARIQREIDEMEAAVRQQQQQQQQQKAPAPKNQQPPPPKSQPSLRRGRKKTMRDASSSSLVSALSCDTTTSSSFRQQHRSTRAAPTTTTTTTTVPATCTTPLVVVRRPSTDTTNSTAALQEQAARIQREIDEMEATMVSAPPPQPPAQSSMRSQGSSSNSSSSSKNNNNNNHHKGSKKVLQRRVRKKPSAHSITSTTRSASNASLEPANNDDQQQQEAELQRQIAEMEAELLSAAVVSSSSKSPTSITPPLPFLAQLNLPKSSGAKREDQNCAIESVGSQPDQPTLAYRTKPPAPAAAARHNDKNEDRNSEQPPPPANPFAAMAGLLGAIASAATDRERRLADGEPAKMTIVAAPVVDPRAAAPQLSTSLAEMVSARAAARDNRLAQGGEKRMTVLQPKAEIKKTFAEIVAEAASMGRLTRLDEHVVVAIAGEKTIEEEWKSKGLLAIQWQRSNHMAVIHEAARVGNEVKMTEQVVSNVIDEETDDDLMGAFATKPVSERKRQLLEASSTIGEGQAKVDKLIMYRKEEQPKDHLLIKPMEAYGNKRDKVVLPRAAPPRVDPVRNAQKLDKYKRELLVSGRPMVDISNLVAERAWERRARLDRPGSMPKMVEKCQCPFCQSASPYQTFAYRELFKNRHEIAAQKEVERVEMERLREERRRQREEKRRLEQEVAEAEAAIAAAKTAATTRKPLPDQQQLEQAPTAVPDAVMMLPLTDAVATPPCCACTIM
jgi:hypothetical protein